MTSCIFTCLLVEERRDRPFRLKAFQQLSEVRPRLISVCVLVCCVRTVQSLAIVPEFFIKAALVIVAPFVKYEPAAPAAPTAVAYRQSKSCLGPVQFCKDHGLWWFRLILHTAVALGRRAAPADAATAPTAMLNKAIVAADLRTEYRDFFVSSSKSA